jgi:hypothetical protein
VEYVIINNLQTPPAIRNGQYQVFPPGVDQRRNQFQMVRKPYKTSLKKSVQQYINASQYAPYIITSITPKTLKIQATGYDNNVIRNTRYLFLNIANFSKYIGDENKLSGLLYNAYHVSYGLQAPSPPSNKNFKVEAMGIPIQMPSRDKAFRD